MSEAFSAFMGGLQEARASSSGISSSTPGGGALLGTFGRPSTLGSTSLRDMPHVKDYGAKGGARAVATGGGITATQNIFTDGTNNPFRASDVGKTLIIPGAGAAGRPFAALIIGYSNTSSVTIASPAVTTVTNSAYRYGWDDTSACSSALIASAGAHLSFMNDTYILNALVPRAGSVYWGYGAQIYKTPGTTTSGRSNSQAMIYGHTTDGVTLNSGFGAMGFTFHGEGVAGYTVSDAGGSDACGIALQQWSNAFIHECAFDGFYVSGVLFRDCQRVWVDRCLFTNNGINQGRNALNYGDSPTGGTSVPLGDFWFTNNYFDKNFAESLGIACTFTSPAYLRGQISGNRIIHSGTAAALGVEINSYNAGASTGFARRLDIRDNYIERTVTGTGIGGCVSIADDSPSNYANDTTKVQDVIISGNTLITADGASAGSGWGAISLAGSNATISNNLIKATGTSGRCVLLKGSSGSDATLYQQIVIGPNRGFYQTNVAAVNPVVELNQATQVTYHHSPIYSASTANSKGHGIYLNNVFQPCSKVEIRDTLIDSPANNGIHLVGETDVVIRQVTIRNPNASSQTNNALGCGIYSAAGAGGTLNAYDGCTIFDDRGPTVMRFAVSQPVSGASNPLLLNNVLQGAVSGNAVVNGIANFTLIKGNTTDQPDVFPAATTSPTAPASGSTLGTANYRRHVYWFGGTVTAVMVTPASYAVMGPAPNQVSSDTPGFATLEPGDDISWTYTVAPTLRVYGVA